MFKLIVLLVLFRIFWKLIIAPIFNNRSFVIDNNQNHQNNNSKGYHNKDLKKLIKCQLCNIYLPIEDAIYQNGDPFCCQEHAKQTI